MMIDRKNAAAVAGIFVVVGGLVFMTHRSSPLLTGMSRPDVDAMVSEMALLNNAEDGARYRERIASLGEEGVRSLRAIAGDRERSGAQRCYAIMLLQANPEATFDLLSLIDDPDTSVRFSARESVRQCLSDLSHPRYPRSDTEAELLRRWHAEHGAEGMAALTFRDAPRTSSDSSPTSRSIEDAYRCWISSGKLASSSPFLSDLKTMGRPAVDFALREADSDSAVRRSAAYVALGMLGDTAIAPILRDRLARARKASDIRGINIALSLLERQSTPPADDR
jgi:hypothetical protein